jgi:anti-sigma B factor antagonist
MVSFEAVVRYSGDVAIIDLTGRIVLNDGSAAVREAIAKLREAGSSKILLNMADVSFMDSSGLGELASAYARMNKDGGQLKLANLPSRIVDLLRITKLDSVLVAFPNEAAALQSFGNGTASA